MLSLAKAMPADIYFWRPYKGVYSVEKVFTHIARYNFYYLESSLDIPAPDEVDVKNMESMTGKKSVVSVLERSIEHVKTEVLQMSDAKLGKPAELYGRTVTTQAVLLQLLTHLSEHVGQSIVYARVNRVIPPWNRQPMTIRVYGSKEQRYYIFVI